MSELIRVWLFVTAAVAYFSGAHFIALACLTCMLLLPSTTTTPNTNLLSLQRPTGFGSKPDGTAPTEEELAERDIREAIRQLERGNATSS